jgi:hypothetical protein
MSSGGIALPNRNPWTSPHPKPRSIWAQHINRGQSVSALPRRLDVNLLRNRDGIVYLDAKISNRAFDFGVTKKQLHGP